MSRPSSANSPVVVVLLCAMLLTGLALLLYPSVADWWNGLGQSQAIATYLDGVDQLDPAAHHQMWAQAEAYNVQLTDQPNRFSIEAGQDSEYWALLDPSGTGVMGYLDIPSLDLTIPIYHGTGDEVLQVAVGHIQGSSLPVGGEGTHCALSGHRGLPSARLFTDVDQLSRGDFFTLRVLGQTLTYQVDQIRTVSPDDFSFLEIQEGEDLCTLVTCTPYGVNTHRLLIRGRRVESQPTQSLPVPSEDAAVPPPRLAAAGLVFLLLPAVALGVALGLRRRRKIPSGKR